MNFLETLNGKVLSDLDAKSNIKNTILEKLKDIVKEFKTEEPNEITLGDAYDLVLSKAYLQKIQLFENLLHDLREYAGSARELKEMVIGDKNTSVPATDGNTSLPEVTEITIP